MGRDSNPQPPACALDSGSGWWSGLGTRLCAEEYGFGALADRRQRFSVHLGHLVARFKLGRTCALLHCATRRLRYPTDRRRCHVCCEMVVDICATCGEEHEPPRGSKCKRTKLLKHVKEESSSGGETVALASTRPSAIAEGEQPGTSAVMSASLGRVEAFEEDEEEKTLRKLLAAKDCERRKMALRAALEDEPTKPGKAKEKVKSKSAKVEKLKIKKEKDETVVKPEKKASGKESDSDDDEPEDSSEESSSSSSSSSESDSDDKRSRSKRRRRKRSKFSLYKFTPDEKRLKKCTFIELIYASLCWVLKRGERVGMEYKELKGYVGHIAYMCMHASMNNYTDRAFRCYDKAIRDRAKEKGLKAFRMGNSALSLVHFNLNNIRGSREVRKPSRTTFSGRSYSVPSKVCYSFNYSRDGCVSKRCEYEHKCIVCKGSDHTVSNCKQKKY